MTDTGYDNEEAEAAYASYEDDLLYDTPHSEECCCEDCLQDYPERDALYNDCQFYGVPSDGTVAMLCSYPGCEAIAEIIQDGEPIPAGSIGRKHLFCPEHDPDANNIQATEGIRDEIGTTLMVGARKIQKIQTPSVRGEQTDDMARDMELQSPPTDGERHGDFQYISAYGYWMYLRSYDAWGDCSAQCEYIAQKYGVGSWVECARAGGYYYPAANVSNTEAIRAIDANKG